MKTIFGFLIMLYMTMNVSGQQINHDRDPVAAGSFYPAGKQELSRQLTGLFNEAGKEGPGTCEPGSGIRAVITPHAGYVYSGLVSASAYLYIPEGTVYDNIFIIGSSHRAYFPGASVYNVGDYKTPLGTVKVNTELANKLTEGSSVFSYFKEAHSSEHSIEVQLPFLQHYLGKNIKIVPVIIGTHDKKMCRKIADELKPYFTPDNLFVISSDFSHYPSFNDAVKIDSMTVESLISGDPGTFLNTLSKNSSMKIENLATSMCGWTSGLVLLYLAENEKDLEFRHLMYRNSGHSVYGDKSSVVGYNSVALVEKKYDEPQKKTFEVSKSGQEKLIDIARRSIRSVLYREQMPEFDESSLPQDIKSPFGAFVTLNLDNQLRGCIGRFMPDKPLHLTVSEMAKAAAFNDTRFSPLNREEFEKIKIEISVLSPLEKIDDINKIELGKHGVYIVKDRRSGTFLPQVANDRNWKVTDFLGYIARDKAGIGWTGWKDADIYIYEAFVFGEE